MKSLSPAMQAHLDEGTTTLAWCWRITRADGVTFGFTDHDRTLSFDGTDFEPESGLTASEVRSGSDLSVDAQDAEGVLISDRITETDILDGRWPSRGSSATHVSLATAIWLQTMVPLTAGDTVELQGYFRVADGYFAADHTSFWGCKVA